ncbi:hypothetical protein BGW36DRAFT_435847 [Talaromyces proteolyticus]|uniref:Uncharacterized protein n=1 Tax=Talaromyces proteolyticus TaxID=1131652 RepID=A0AAD4Q463_9EURO|nr:uncharacterized protein BGW36DRAFT_435847 [Talaromyces proteolyticus]KAH8705834.1 hypothetical protein BGW36DRAFT_435847 [Talaromyces proteolyticus]
MKAGRTSHGHLDYIPPLYNQTTPGSPLALATVWLSMLSMRITCERTNTQEHHAGETRQLAKVIRAVQDAIADPARSVDIETLAAVVIIGYGEHLRSTTESSSSQPEAALKTFVIHQAGAEALIRKRGGLNFQDYPSLALFDAVRHNAVSLAITGARRHAFLSWDLWYITDINVRHLCDSYTPATNLDAYGVKIIVLQSRIAKLKNKSMDEINHIKVDLLDLLERLRSWKIHISEDWVFTGMATDGTLEQVHMSPEMCYLLNEWYFHQLRASHLLKQLNKKLNTTEVSTQSFCCEMEWIDDVIASSHQFLSNSPHLTLNIPLSKKAGCLSSIQPSGASWIGSRLFGQTLYQLDIILSDALRCLFLPQVIESRYREVMNWARGQRRMCVNVPVI